jgi:hypothetical protein
VVPGQRAWHHRFSWASESVPSGLPFVSVDANPEHVQAVTVLLWPSSAPVAAFTLNAVGLG